MNEQIYGSIDILSCCRIDVLTYGLNEYILQEYGGCHNLRR